MKKIIGLMVLMGILMLNIAFAVRDNDVARYIFHDNASYDTDGTIINIGDNPLEHSWAIDGVNETTSRYEQDENGIRFLNFSSLDQSPSEFIAVAPNDGREVNGGSDAGWQRGGNPYSLEFLNETWGANWMLKRGKLDPDTSTHRLSFARTTSSNEISYSVDSLTDILTTNCGLSYDFPEGGVLNFSIIRTNSTGFFSETINGTTAECNFNISNSDPDVFYMKLTPSQDPNFVNESFQLYFLNVYNGTDYPSMIEFEPEPEPETQPSFLKSMVQEFKDLLIIGFIIIVIALIWNFLRK